MIRLFGGLFLLALGLVLMVNGKTNIKIGSGRLAVSSNEFEECQRRGIKYYRDIDSYPLLSTGKLAEERISISCNRTSKAF